MASVQTFQGTRRYRVTTADVRQQGNTRQLPETVGKCVSCFSTISEGFTLASSHYQPRCPLVEETHSPHPQPMLVITFGLSGNSFFRSDSGHETPFCQQHTTITSFGDSRGERHYQSGETIAQLRLLLTRNCLRHYLGEEATARLFSEEVIVNHAYLATSPAAAGLLAQLAGSGHDPLMQQIHALNLFALHRHLLHPAERVVVRPADGQRIEAARDWMLAHLAEPFTLGALALAVGLSEYQLKQGFQRRYHTTPGQMLLQLRMERAQRLLEQGYQVAQAGWQVGYRHANNFSVAYRRYFDRPARQSTAKKLPG